jgi:hypothetical protein
MEAMGTCCSAALHSLMVEPIHRDSSEYCRGGFAAGTASEGLVNPWLTPGRAKAQRSSAPDADATPHATAQREAEQLGAECPAIADMQEEDGSVAVRRTRRCVGIASFSALELGQSQLPFYTF